jgi:predicted nucleic acid-binding Zn ribbon protein
VQAGIEHETRTGADPAQNYWREKMLRVVWMIVGALMIIMMVLGSIIPSLGW